MRAWALGIGLGVWCFASAVAADAVPPEPDDCPSGTVGVTDHSGPRCEKAAPTSCPAGWRGAIGGDCVLDLCSDDSQCTPRGRVCREFSLCHQPQQRWYGRGDPGPESATQPVMFGPRQQLETPVTDWVPINVCGGSEKCASPSECRAGKLCVPANAPTPSVMPRKPDGSVDARPSGCGGGCVGAASRGVAGGVAVSLAGVALLFVALRRRRRRA